MSSEINDKVYDRDAYIPVYQNYYYPNDGITNKRQFKAFAEKSGGSNNPMNMMRALIALRRY